MSHYKPYPAYKPSGVEWLGPVPAHWDVVPIKRASKLRNDRVSEAPPASAYVGLEDVEPEFGRYAPTGAQSRQSEDSMVGTFRPGDVLYGKLRPYLRKAIVAEQDGICSTEFLVIEASRARPDWLHRWLLTPTVTQQIESGCDGAKMPRADWEHVGSIALPLPPEEEQAAIADALKRETSRIDALIAKKSKFIALLTKKRQALITHAVTKGLDPRTITKDSGADWIGDVPRHWSMPAIKHVASIGNGSTPKKDDGRYWDGGSFPWLTSGCVNSDEVWAAEEFVTEEALKECHLPMIAPPAVLVGITGQGKTRGMAATLKIAATINQHIAFLKPRLDLIRLEFLRRFIDAAYDRLRLDSEGAGSTKGAITCEQLANMRIPLPPLYEQDAIVAALQSKTVNLDRLLSRTRESIELLKQRRSALITAAVTGQIDLRKAA